VKRILEGGEHMASGGDITYVINVNGSGAVSGINNVVSSMDKMHAAGLKLAKVGGMMTLAITTPIVALGKKMLDMATNAVESENLFTVSMGNMADAARKWSEDTSKALGLNQYALRNTVGTFNVMFNSMGLGEKAAYQMSISLSTLAQDMASFYNLSSEEAFQKLQAGISGETEPLKRLGILINETTVKTFALSKGLITEGQDMSETQKVIARYLLIMEQTKNAQGDLARTMDSPANMARRQQARLEELAITMGQKLLPTFVKIMEAIDGLITWFTNLDDKTQENILKFAAFAAAAGPVLTVVGGLTTGFSGLAGVLKGIPALIAACATPMGGFALVAGAAVISTGITIDNFNKYKKKQEDMVAAAKSKEAGTSNIYDPNPMIQVQKQMEAGTFEIKPFSGFYESTAEQTEAAETEVVTDAVVDQTSAYDDLIAAFKEAGTVGTTTYSELTDSVNTFKDAVKQQTDAFADFGSMFEKNVIERMSPEKIMRRLQKSFSTMKKWTESLQKLQDRGVSESIIDSLRDMGISGAGITTGLAKMSNAQLSKALDYMGATRYLGAKQAYQSVKFEHTGRIEIYGVNSKGQLVDSGVINMLSQEVKSGSQRYVNIPGAAKTLK